MKRGGAESEVARVGAVPGRATRVAAFFDLDGTLLSVNSGRLWVEYQRRIGRISRRDQLEAMVYLFGYWINRIDIDHVMRRALRTVRGDLEVDIREQTRAWYLDRVAPLAAPGGGEALRHHREAGHLLVLLTSSSPYESEIAAAHLGLDTWLCSRYEVQKGRFTGDFEHPLCYGAGKVYYAERLAAERGLDLAQSYFYTDSATDIPMLERVGHPQVVNPDWGLRRQARRRGWPILDWRRAP